MAAAHPYVAFVGCGIKRIGCARRIKVNFGTRDSSTYVIFGIDIKGSCVFSL